MIHFDAQHQGKIEEIQSGKKDLADRVEALRTVKETAEQPEKEAKERHLKAWEGRSTYSTVLPAIYCLLRELHYSLNCVYSRTVDFFFLISAEAVSYINKKNVSVL